jgi:O-antigen/teichoic acid export membrane protein
VGAGRAPQVARLMVLFAASNLALALVLTPKLGVEGPALATTIPFVLGFPLMLRNGLLVTGVSVSELVRRAFGPAYAVGLALAAILIAIRLLAEPSSLAVVGVTAIAGVLGSWAACYLLVFDESERALVKSLLRPVRDQAGEGEG